MFVKAVSGHNIIDISVRSAVVFVASVFDPAFITGLQPYSQSRAIGATVSLQWAASLREGQFNHDEHALARSPFACTHVARACRTYVRTAPRYAI